jgi:hypothetical protein
MERSIAEAFSLGGEVESRLLLAGVEIHDIKYDTEEGAST